MHLPYSYNMSSRELLFHVHTQRRLQLTALQLIALAVMHLPHLPHQSQPTHKYALTCIYQWLPLRQTVDCYVCLFSFVFVCVCASIWLLGTPNCCNGNLLRCSNEKLFFANIFMFFFTSVCAH